MSSEVINVFSKACVQEWKHQLFKAGERQQCVFIVSLVSRQTFIVVVSCTKLGQLPGS